MSAQNKNKIILGSSAVGLVLIVSAYFYFKNQHSVATDDAFVDAHIIPMSSKVAGQVIAVSVADNQRVEKDTAMVEIDPAPYQVALEEERAKLASAEAEAKRSSADTGRYDSLFKKDEVSEQQRDNIQTAAAAARAAMERERAAVHQAELNLSYTKIMAPVSGTITRKSVESGMYVQVGQPLLSLVSDEVWVTANFKETQLTEIKPQQPVTIKIDAYPGKELHGRVDSIQLGTGARFSLFPPENATGNFVKVVQRVPVKIVLDKTSDGAPVLAPGMSVEAIVNVQ